MTGVISWVALIAAIGVPALLFLLRSYFAAWIKESVRVDFEKTMEAVRSDFRRSEEAFRADLRAKEAEIEAIRAGALEGRAKRQAIIAMRRIECLESIWVKFNKLAVLKFSAQSFATLKIEEIEKRSANDVNVRRFAETLIGNDPLENIKDIQIGPERIYIPEIVWAVFSAYQSILITCFAHLKMLSVGIEKGSNLIKWDKVSEITKAVLPHQAQYIDKYGYTVLPYLLEEIENKMLAEIQAALTGGEQDAEAIAQSAEIMKKVNAVVTPEVE